MSTGDAFAKTPFRILKYRPAYPAGDFSDLAEARARVLAFVRWYNTEHRRGALCFVTPEQSATPAADAAVLARRRALYEQARARHPERWRADVRDCSRGPRPVTPNPAGAAAQPPARTTAKAEPRI